MLYLYIKRHRKTGLKYFGKTIRDPYKYNGSGIHWLNHCKKHGFDIDTIDVFEFDNQEECTKFALEFSKNNCIVESDEWANHVVEDGLGGRGVKGKRPPEFGKRLSQLKKGKPSWHKGRKKPESTCNNMKGRSGAYKKSEEHKQKIRNARALQKMKPHSEETKQKIRESRLKTEELKRVRAE